ncbi:hypothetical protein K438DRAFT_1674240, partial [Mycena galopus ATCC 62051]
MDWYTGIVGETPCDTYQRLRQMCNPECESCGSFWAGCCCNSIAFSLSMLCLNCQQDIGTGTGYDAPAGTMQKYFNASYDGTKSVQSHCYTPVYKNFSTDIQTDVCNQDIKILKDLYPIEWSDGSWYSVHTSETLHEDTINEANNSFPACNQPSNTTNPSHSTNANPSLNSSLNNSSMHIKA